MKVKGQYVAIVLVVLVCVDLTAATHAESPPLPDRVLAPGEITLQEVQNWNEPVLWIDARPESDYQLEHIPRAISLNPDNWSEQLPHFLDRWRPTEKVVVYCSVASCDASREIAERLRRSGVDPVFCLEGGWEAWKASRLSAQPAG